MDILALTTVYSCRIKTEVHISRIKTVERIDILVCIDHIERRVCLYGYNDNFYNYKATLSVHITILVVSYIFLFC